MDISGNQLHIIRYRGLMPGRQIIVYDRCKIFGRCQRPYRMGADVAGAACYKMFIVAVSLSYFKI